MPWQEAILIEFSRSETKMRTQNTFTHVNDPTDKLDVPIPATPTVLKRNLSIEPPRTQLYLALPGKSSSKHVRLSSSDPVNAAAYPITSGQGMMALFDDEDRPRTRYNMIVSDIDDSGHSAIAILEARLTLSEVCAEYPQLVRGTLLRVFFHEGWSPALIFANLDADQRKVSSGPNPWLWLEEAMEKQKKFLIETYGEAEDAAATTSTTPKSKKIMAPKWTAAEDLKVVELRAEGKTQKQIAQALGRTLSAVQSRVHTLKKKADAAAAVASASGSDQTVDDTMQQAIVVADQSEAGGDAMQLD